MENKLLELFKNGKFEELENKLKELYPQIDTIEWNADNDGDVDLHIVFVKMPYMLPFSGSSYAHFGDLDGSTYGEGLEEIMAQCRVIQKDDLDEIEFANYRHDLLNRGYDEDEDYDIWEIVKEIREDEGLETLYRVVSANGKDCIYEGYEYSEASKIQHSYNCCGDWYIEEEEMED